MVRFRSARRALAAVVLALSALVAVATAPAASATELQSRVSGEGVAFGQPDPNTVVSRDGGLTWAPAYVVGAAFSHPFDTWFPEANVSSAANWIACQPNFESCINETVLYRTFIVLPNQADLSLSFRVLADNAATPYINGEPAGPRFVAFGSVDVDSTLLHPGVNTFDMVFEDHGGLSGFRWELFGTLIASANPDADQDGVPDPDEDGDGVPDATDNCLTTPNTDQVDTESDGAGDVCDDDDDNDGLPDDVDPDPLDPNADSDGDGTIDATDNCLTTANTDQADNDGDGEGDACDADDDNDGTPDDGDAFPLDPSEDTDTDGDGQGDNGDACPNDADNDADGDGVCGDIDNCPTTANASQADFDGDGDGDACDTDDDNDGVDDSNDAFPFDETEWLDTDGDDIGNNSDICPNDADNDADGDGTCGDVDILPLDPDVTTETADAGGICSVVQRLATKHGAKVSLCNHLMRAQAAANNGDARKFSQAMSVFDKELTAQTKGRNAAFTAAHVATIRSLAALWTL